MKILEFINQFKNHPILFMGTGISLRYYEDSYTWDQLLTKLCTELYGDEEVYLNLKYKCKNDYPLIASELEKSFDEVLEKDRNGKFKPINDLFFERMKQGKPQCSRMKLYLSSLFENLKVKDSMKEEIDVLVKAKKNICSIITTNYDKFVEDNMDFSPLVGNKIILSNPYGSVYKIHGSIDCPDSLVITQEDYSNFNIGNELIKAQLISLFIHNPIIFLGYGMNDDDIKSILETIFRYVTPNSEEAKLIQRNFLLVDYEKDSNNTIVEDYSITLKQNNSIRINKLVTDDFSSIYAAIANLKLPITVMDIRKVETVIHKILVRDTDDAIQVRITDDIDSLENKETILAIGSERTIKYEYLSIKEMIKRYFDIIENKQVGVLSLIDKQKISSNQYFPIYAFSTINHEIQNTSNLKRQQDRLIENCIQHISDSSKVVHNSIDGIQSDDNVALSYKDDCVIWNVWNGTIGIDDLKQYLISYEGKETTIYRKMLCVYDKKKYDAIVSFNSTSSH